MEINLYKIYIHSHNDLPYQIRWNFENQLDEVDLTRNGSALPPGEVGSEWHTDIPRLRAGKVGGQVSHSPLINRTGIVKKIGIK